MQLSPIQFGMAISIRPTKNAPPLPADELLVSTDKLYELGLTNLVSNDPQNAGLQVSGQDDKALVSRILSLAKAAQRIKSDPRCMKTQTVQEAIAAQAEGADPSKPVMMRKILTPAAQKALASLKLSVDDGVALIQAKLEQSYALRQVKVARQALKDARARVTQASVKYAQTTSRGKAKVKNTQTQA